MQHEEKFIALDAKVLVAETAGVPHVVRVLEHFRKRGFFLRITPTSWAVLNDTYENEPAGQERDLLHRTIQNVLDSDIVRTSTSETYRQVIDIHADRIHQDGVLGACTKAHIMVILEASHFDCIALITTSQEILGALESSLKGALIDSGLKPVFITSPQQFDEYLQAFAAIEAKARGEAAEEP